MSDLRLTFGSVDGQNTTRPYRVVARIKNNRLWQAILDLFPSVKTQADAARVLGVRQQHLGKILNMIVWPCQRRAQQKYRGPRWWKIAVDLSVKLAQPPEYLFDPALYGKPPIPRLELEIGPRDLVDLSLVSVPLSPLESVERSNLREELDRALHSLTIREEQVVRLRFGLDGGPERTNQEIAASFNLTRERIRQIEAKAIQKLRDPKRTNALREFVEA